MRALLIGDDQSLAAQIADALAKNEIAASDIDRCASAQALAKLQSAQFDLALVTMGDDAEDNLALLARLARETSIDILAIGTPDDPKFILRALREGAREFLDRNEMEAEIRTALARLGLHRATRAEDNATLIGVCAPSGGCGASTIAANLAVTYAKGFERAAVIDLRIGAADQELLLDLKPPYTLAELCAEGERVDRVLFQQYLTRHSSGTYLLAAPSFTNDLAHVTPDGVQRTLAIARSCFPYVVVDIDRSFSPIQQTALRRCDAVVLAMRLDMVSLRATRRAIELLERLEIAAANVHVAINRYGQSKELPYRQAEQALGIKNIHYLPEDAAWANHCLNQGVPLVVERPKAKLAKRLATLAEKLQQTKARVAPARAEHAKKFSSPLSSLATS
ncbi:MAG: hypothetical protein KDA42_14305, partial [Planctomycetales bacterium]|nr:hypothetical protein [Planctomycetales bacterium]